MSFKNEPNVTFEMPFTQNFGRFSQAVPSRLSVGNLWVNTGLYFFVFRKMAENQLDRLSSRRQTLEGF